MQRIMVVDDDPYIIIAVREIFEEEGFEVYACNSGRECIKELEKGFKGVILMDIMMPQMDGWTTIKEIINKGLHKGNIISMLSAKDLSFEKMQFEDYIKDYLTKPFESDMIIRTVKGYFDSM